MVKLPDSIVQSIHKLGTRRNRLHGSNTGEGWGFLKNKRIDIFIK